MPSCCGVMAGVREAARLGIAHLVAETDATMVQEAIQGEDYRLSAMGGIITEIKHLLASEFVSVSIVVNSRDCNNVTHACAARGCRLVNESVISWEHVPEDVGVLVASDLAGAHE